MSIGLVFEGRWIQGRVSLPTHLLELHGPCTDWFSMYLFFFFFCISYITCILLVFLFYSMCDCCCSVTKLYPTLWPHGLQHPRFLCPLLSSGACSTLSQWCYLTISSSSAPFSFCLQSCPVLGSFPINRLLVSVDQNIRASASAAVLPVNIQGWFPLGLTVSLTHSNDE